MKKVTSLVGLLVLVAALGTPSVSEAGPAGAQAGGKITHSKSGDPVSGSWRFVHRADRGVYKITLRLAEETEGETSRSRWVTIECRSAVFTQPRHFVHVAEVEMVSHKERTLGFVFAWGDETTFEAALLPYTPANEAIFQAGFAVDSSELLTFVEAVIDGSSHVIYGTTKTYNTTPWDNIQ